GPPQLAVDQLALELEPDDEEEDREQAVRRPLREREIEMQRRGPDDDPAEPAVRVAPRRVRPRERDDRAEQQQRGARVLRTQRVRDVAERAGPGFAEEGSPVGHGLLVSGSGRRTPPSTVTRRDGGRARR